MPPQKRGDYLTYKMANGKTVKIPNEELEKSMKHLGLSFDDAVALWLEDNDYEVNEEQNALDEKAKKVKIQHDAVNTEPRKKSDKPRTVKVSDEKKELFHKIYSELLTYGNSNATILKENKLIQVKIGEKIFKIDIIETRPPKKK